MMFLFARKLIKNGGGSGDFTQVKSFIIKNNHHCPLLTSPPTHWGQRARTTVSSHIGALGLVYSYRA